MPSGFESYVTLMDSAPASALSLARQHLQWLMEQQGPRVGDAGASYDPSTLKDAIDFVSKHIDSLSAKVNGTGLPTFIPVRRGRFG